MGREFFAELLLPLVEGGLVLLEPDGLADARGGVAEEAELLVFGIADARGGVAEKTDLGVVLRGVY